MPLVAFISRRPAHRLTALFAITGLPRSRSSRSTIGIEAQLPPGIRTASASARSVLFAPPAAAVVAAIAGALLVAALLAGRTRGPVVSDPFRAWLLTAVDIPGRATLRGSFARSASGVGLVIVAITTITGLGLWFGGGVTGASIVGFVAGSALFSVLLTTAWLAGQALDDHVPLGHAPHAAG